MPLPTSLNHINLWLLDDGDGVALVDTGIFSNTSKEVWAGRVRRRAQGPQGDAAHRHPRPSRPYRPRRLAVPRRSASNCGSARPNGRWAGASASSRARSWSRAAWRCSAAAASATRPQAWRRRAPSPACRRARCRSDYHRLQDGMASAHRRARLANHRRPRPRAGTLLPVVPGTRHFHRRRPGAAQDHAQRLAVAGPRRRRSARQFPRHARQAATYRAGFSVLVLPSHNLPFHRLHTRLQPTARPSCRRAWTR